MKPLWGAARTLAFGVLAALGVVAWQFSFMYLFGADNTLRVYLVLCAAALPLAIAPSLRAAFGSLLITAPLGLCALLFTGDVAVTLLGAALTVSLARAVMFRAHPGRSLALEAALLLVSLLAATLFGGGRPFELALGLWSYCLVQSAYFLCLRPTERRVEAEGDAFEVAHQRALTLLADRAPLRTESR